MTHFNSPFGFVIGVFDVLGFEYRLKKFGLDEISNRYYNIVKFVKGNSERNRLLFDIMGISGPMFTSDGHIAVAYDIQAIYASDTIMIWANLAWKAAQSMSVESLKEIQNNPKYSYLSQPIPLTPFLTTCADIICKSIDMDLPLRGAVAMGDAVLDQTDRVFLGDPIIEATRLESTQQCIGVSICNSYVEQDDHKKYFLPYKKHFKNLPEDQAKNYALNWPLYWKTKKESDLKSKIKEMAKRNNNHPYYINTLRFIEYSENFDYCTYWKA